MTNVGFEIAETLVYTFDHRDEGSTGDERFSWRIESSDGGFERGEVRESMSEVVGRFQQTILQTKLISVSFRILPVGFISL